MSDQSNPNNVPTAAGVNLPEAVGGNVATPGFDKDFVGEFANMDLSPLKDKLYMVGVATGDNQKGRFLCSSAHGPYDFLEMVQEIGMMWAEHQHHGRAIILEKDNKKRVRFLDANTIDYIEANYENIIAESVLEDALAQSPTEYTHTAGFTDITFDADQNPQLQEKQSSSEEEPEEN